MNTLIKDNELNELLELYTHLHELGGEVDEINRRSLAEGGVLLMSGILECDIEQIVARAEELGLHFVEKKLRDGWAVVRVER